MLATHELVSVIVDGHALIGWQDVSVDRSMESAEIGFALGAANPSWSAEAKRLRTSRQLQVVTAPLGAGAFGSGGGNLLCDGYVSGYAADYGPDSKTVNLDGKSKAADAVDCHPVKHKTGRIEKKTLLDAAKELDEVGVGWTTDQSLKPIAKIQRQPGDTIFQTIEREARREGLMLAGQPTGKINITRAGTRRHAGALVLGQCLVERMSVKIRCDQKFSPLVGRGQRAGGATAGDLQVEHRETDPSVTRHRPLIIVPEGDWSKRELKKRLQWERLRRAAYGITITVEVSTWRDAAGALWEPGLLMPLVNPPEDVDGDFLLSTVNFRQGLGDGTRATLTFVDPKSQGGKAGRGKTDKAFDAGAALDEE